MRAVIYGAGNIGRGFIARLFAGSGYKITFIDTAAPLIEALNSEKRYPVRLLSPGNTRDVWIEDICAISGLDAEKAEQAIAGADILATAVGVRVLPAIAPVIARGLRKRFNNNGKPLNIIICENLIDADHVLAQYIKDELESGELHFLDQTGFIKASIGCMVPIQTEAMKDGNSLRICTEDYSRLPVDKKAFRGEIPSAGGLEAYGNFDFYMERKLFIHNMGHGICAYLGMYLGDEFIYEAVNRPDILFIAQNAMLESAFALSGKHNEPITDLYLHIMDLLRRFANRALGDTCARVGADTVRKLGPRDRFAGAIRCCEDQNVKPLFASIGAAAALYRYLAENNLAQEKSEACRILEEVSQLPRDSSGSGLIVSMYSHMSGEKTLFNSADHSFPAAQTLQFFDP